MSSATESITTSEDPAAWTAETVGTPADWTHPFPTRLIDALRSIYEQRGGARRPATEMVLSAEEKLPLVDTLARARRDLEAGRGFVVLDRLPLDQVSDHEAVALYWMVGQLLGEPFAQNVQGTLLYDVRDTGQSIAAGARFSVTNYESSFHTDNSFGETVLDYVGLLCLKTARSGGISQVVSGVTAVDVFRQEDPEALETLCRPFHVDRRGGIRDGEAATVLRPVIEADDAMPLYRYLRYWIEAGHEKAATPLTDAQRNALDRLDEVLNRPSLRAEFSLEPGQVYFINNRWILHNRTAYEDHPEPELRRHLVRLWLEQSESAGTAR